MSQDNTAGDTNASTTAPTTDAAPKVKLIAGRVLVAGRFGKPDDIVQLPKEEAEAAKAAGEIDTTPAAVAYARSLQAPSA